MEVERVNITTGSKIITKADLTKEEVVTIENIDAKVITRLNIAEPCSLWIGIFDKNTKIANFNVFLDQVGLNRIYEFTDFVYDPEQCDKVPSDYRPSDNYTVQSLLYEKNNPNNKLTNGKNEIQFSK